MDVWRKPGERGIYHSAESAFRYRIFLASLLRKTQEESNPGLSACSQKRHTRTPPETLFPVIKMDILKGTVLLK